MRERMIDRMMAEFIVCGGLVMRRSEAHRWLRETGVTGRALDYFTFRPEALDVALPAETVRVDVSRERDGSEMVNILRGPICS